VNLVDVVTMSQVYNFGLDPEDDDRAYTGGLLVGFRQRRLGTFSSKPAKQDDELSHAAGLCGWQ
jgi:hypothetical protein